MFSVLNMLPHKNPMYFSLSEEFLFHFWIFLSFSRNNYKMQTLRVFRNHNIYNTFFHLQIVFIIPDTPNVS